MIDDVKKFAVQKIHICEGRHGHLTVYENEHLIIDGDIECESITVVGTLELKNVPRITLVGKG